jgi:hypothetical protein
VLYLGWSTSCLLQGTMQAFLRSGCVLGSTSLQAAVEGRRSRDHALPDRFRRSLDSDVAMKRYKLLRLATVVWRENSA